MFYKNARNSIRSGSTASSVFSEQYSQHNPSNPARLVLVSSGSSGTPQSQRSSSLIDLVAVAAPRCSSFFAEAAVLVLVLALLDRFMAKGRLETSWIVSAIVISVALLTASVATDFTARRWLKAH